MARSPRPMPSVRILIIDDSESDAQILASKLAATESMIAHVTVAKDLSRAFRELGRGFDLAILDLHLPGSQGTETLASFRAGAPKLPVIVTSGDSNRLIFGDCLRMGAVDFLVKNDLVTLAPAVLELKIRMALERAKSTSVPPAPPIPGTGSVIVHELNDITGAIRTVQDELKSIQLQLAEQAGNDRGKRTTIAAVSALIVAVITALAGFASTMLDSFP